MSAAEKERVAYHEAGHALVALMNCLACQLPSAVWENYTEMRQHNNLGMRHGFREHRCLTERQFLTLAGDFRADWMTKRLIQEHRSTEAAIQRTGDDAGFDRFFEQSARAAHGSA